MSKPSSSPSSSPRQKIRFPDPRLAGEEGLLCVGGDLEVETLREAYAHGIFPWPQEGYPMLWFSPLKRGVLEFENLHWPKRFLRSLKDPSFTISFDQAFVDVIRECAKVPRQHENGTWILPEMIDAYIRLHEAGSAHSVECWQEGVLVGGLYGVFSKGVFSGESMFYRVSDASKRCLHSLIERLRGKGLDWIDIQMVTPILQTLGGTYISRDDYLTRVKSVQESAIGEISF